MSEDHKTTLDGSGATAQDGSRAVGERGVLVERDIGGDVVTSTKVVIYQGEPLRIPMMRRWLRLRSSNSE